eukprot:1005439-Alexandrium_andersonii.AAC.1
MARPASKRGCVCTSTNMSNSQCAWQRKAPWVKQVPTRHPEKRNEHKSPSKPAHATRDLERYECAPVMVNSV